MPQLHMLAAVPRVPVPTRMRTGPRYQIWPSEDVYRTGLLNATTVSSSLVLLSLQPRPRTNVYTGKKLKRRLEDLERRAGSSSASPEQSHAEIVPVHQNRQREDEGKRRRVKTENSAPNQGRSPNLHSVPSSSPRDDPSSMFSRQYTRQRSVSPPPSFTYSYPAPDPPIHAPYPQHAPFISLPAPYSDYQGQPLYLPPLPVTLPSMSSYDNVASKPGNPYTEDDFASHFSMNYSASMNGIEVPTSQSYADSNSYVNNPELHRSEYSFQFS